MEQFAVLTRFATLFIKRGFSARFLHEAVKRPRDLHRRISHDIESIIDPVHKHQAHGFGHGDACIFLSLMVHFRLTTWQNAEHQMASGSGGYLVIRADGRAFYAETASHPPIIYAGTR